MIDPQQRDGGASLSGGASLFVLRVDFALSVLARSVLWFAALLMGIMVALMVSQVVLRYGFSASLSWVEEAIRFLMIWMSFLGATVVVWHRAHITVDVFVRHFPVALQKICQLVSTLCSIAFLLVLMFKGIEYLESVRISIAPALGVSMDRVYLVLPIGAGAMLLFLFRHLLADFGLLPPVATKSSESAHAD